MIKDSFPTGSRVYGTPKLDSDFDIVVLCSQEDAIKVFGYLHPDDAMYPIDENSIHIKKGEVDYILCFNEIRFCTWKSVTETLKKIAPVDRDTAKALFICGFKKEVHDA